MFKLFTSYLSRATKPINISDSRLHVAINKNQLEKQSNICPICHTVSERSPSVKLHHDPDIWFLECSHCHAHSASAMPSQDYLKQYYAGYFEDADIKVSFQDFERFYRHIERLGMMKNASAGAPYHILDFGGGDGRMSLHIAQKFLTKHHVSSVHITLLDYNAPAQSNDARITIQSESDIHAILPASQDMIIASGILEHVPHIGKMLSPLMQSMKSGASFYARVPFAVPMKKLWSGFDLQFPMHVHDMGPAFFKCLCNELIDGVELQTSRPSITKTSFSQNPFITLATWCFKLPAHIQVRLPYFKHKALLWPWVGGWEVVIKKR